MWNVRVRMIGYRNVVVAGVRCAGRGRKTWYECVKDDAIVLSCPDIVLSRFEDIFQFFKESQLYGSTTVVMAIYGLH